MGADQIHTIVIGSGIAGMAAANTIANAGHSVIVLQANNYIGGRLKTNQVDLPDGSIFAFDEGASWIHGSCPQNPITQLRLINNLKHNQQNGGCKEWELSSLMGTMKLIETEDDSMVAFDQNGESVDEQLQTQYQIYETLLEQAEQQGGSMKKAFQKLDASKLKDKFFMHNVSNDIEFQTSASIDDLSAQHGQQDSSFEGKQMLVTNGYQAVVTYLSQHKLIKVLLEHEVISVIHLEKGKSSVKCSNGEVFECSNIIISVPIGVLKFNNIKFNPQLPAWKKQAINNIKFGNVCKILVSIRNKRIDTKQHYIGVIANNIDQRGAATYFLNLSGIAHIPAIMTFGLGPNADKLEMMSDQQLKILLAKRLSAFNQNQFVPEDIDIIKTHWRGNPNFRGAYSYAGVVTKPKHWENMAKPIFEHNWHFCGEHTHSKYRGTVHGAYLSGLDVANQVLANFKENQWRYKGKEGNDEEKKEGEEVQENAEENGQEYVQENVQEKKEKKRKRKEIEENEEDVEEEKPKQKKKEQREEYEKEKRQKGKNNKNNKKESSSSEQDNGKKHKKHRRQGSGSSKSR